MCALHSRRLDVDSLYHDELLEAHDDRVLSHLHVAESRAVPDTRTYVQHKLREAENAALAATLLLENDDTHIYVCGDARQMAKDVHDALIEAVAAHHRAANPALSESDARVEAESVLAKLAQTGRYQKDVWY